MDVHRKKTNIKTAIMVLLINLCICNSKKEENDEYKTKYTNTSLNLISEYLDRTLNVDLVKRIDIQSINTNIKNTDDIINIEKSRHLPNPEEMKSDKIVELKINRTDTIEYERLVANGTETYDFLNFTEEPCVGEPEYCNMTREEYLEMLDDYIFPQPYEWVLIGTHAVVFFIGLVGNALVCIAVYRNHAMRTVTNYFIVNLAVADFMVILICLPPTVLWDVTETWFFGTAMCRIVLYFQVSVCFAI